MLMLWWGPPGLHICGEQTTHTHVREKGERSYQHRSLTLRPKTWVVDSNDLQLAVCSEAKQKQRHVSHVKKKKKNLWTTFGSKYAKSLQLTCSHLLVQKKKKRKTSILEFMGGHGVVLRPWQMDFFCFISISELLIQHKRNIDLCHIRIANTTRDLHKLGWK